MKIFLKVFLLVSSVTNVRSETSNLAEVTADSSEDFDMRFVSERGLKLEDLMISEQMMFDDNSADVEDEDEDEDVDEEFDMMEAPNLRRRLTWTEGSIRPAWILSFPESGVAHIMNILQQSSNRRTATNYGHLFLQSDGTFARSGQSAPLYPNGPSWYNMELLPPTIYAGTRSHGTGYCLFCHPRDYSNGNFWWKSASGVQMNDGRRQRLQYNPQDVKRMIHLIRDPYDNVVARFYSYIGLMNINRPDLNIEDTFPLTEKGFRDWCKFQDRGFEQVELKWLPENLRAIAKDVPCRQEFVKWARFHTNAFLMARAREIDYMVLRYEDYVKDQSGTIERVNNYLNYPVENLDIPQTITGDGIWNFRNFYTDDERLAIEKLIRNLSIPPVWFHLQYYTPQLYTDQVVDDPDFHRINDLN